MMAKEKLQFFTFDRLDKINAVYSLVIGKRSNGKSYAAKKKAIDLNIKTGKQFCLIRRWEEDIKGNTGQKVFEDMEGPNGYISIATKGRYNSVKYTSRSYYFCRRGDGGDIEECEEIPFGFAMSISASEHYKGLQYPKVELIIFDEFLAKGQYLVNEFVEFMNLISTTIRYREGIKIIMLGNTINKYCPYFREMGLRNVKNMKPGDLEVYRFADERLTVAVQFSDVLTKKGQPNDYYFAFDNPALKMITTGEWQIPAYPHAPAKIRPKDIIFTFFVDFDNELIQGDVIQQGTDRYIYFHQKTTPVKYPEKDLIYSTEPSPKINRRVKISMPMTEGERRIWNMIRLGRAFYQDNEVGETIRNYLLFCGYDGR